MTANIWYLKIRAVGDLYDLDLDVIGRAQVGFNILIEKRPSATVEEELISILLNASVCSALNTDLFAGSAARLPSAQSSIFLHFWMSQGIAPGLTQNSPTVPPYRHPAAQFAAHAPDYIAARNLASAAFAALTAIVNRTITV